MNQVAIVTGASSGIGAQMALQLARDGWKVGITARRAQELEELANQIRSEGGTVALAVADVTEPGEIRSAFRSIVDQLGPVDLLIANAGMGSGTSALAFSGEAFERLIRVNLIGAAYAIEAVLPSMIERKAGQIVGISSLAGFRGLPGSSGYGASKAGLSALLEGMRPELQTVGITVTTVHPGYVRTPMTSKQTGPQPFLMDADRAAKIILRGVARKQARVDFPLRMAAIVQVVRLMPNWLFDCLSRRLLLKRNPQTTNVVSEARR
jgi:short-subunit dehydrogenase